MSDVPKGHCLSIRSASISGCRMALCAIRQPSIPLHSLIFNTHSVRRKKAASCTVSTLSPQSGRQRCARKGSAPLCRLTTDRRITFSSLTTAALPPIGRMGRSSAVVRGGGCFCGWCLSWWSALSSRNPRFFVLSSLYLPIIKPQREYASHLRPPIFPKPDAHSCQ